MSKKLQANNYARALEQLRILVIITIIAAFFVNQPARAQDPITIRVWGYGLDDARAQARLATFEAAHPEIKIEAVGGNVDVQQLLTAVASGDPPEIVNLDRTQIGSWAARGGIDPIDDLIARDSYDLAQFYPFTIDQVKYQDKVYGIPQFVSIDLVYMNLDNFEKAGIDPASVDLGNWEQLQEIAGQLAQVDGTTVTQTGFDTKTQDGRLWLWAWANGVDLISADGQTANFNDPKVVEALTWAKAVVDAQGGEQARAAFSQTQNFFSAQNPVLIGQTSMTVFENWLLGVLKVDPQANFQATLPKMRNSDQAVTMATGSAFAIPKGLSPEVRDAAWEFIKGMSSTEAWLAGEEATFKANTDAGEPFTPSITGNIAVDEQVWSTIYTGISPAYDDAVKLFAEGLKVAKYPYSGPVAAEIKDLTTAAVNDALQGVRTPQEALDDLQAKAQQAIDDYNKAAGS
jgi:multiple sugar transport system substrate-binding protein